MKKTALGSMISFAMLLLAVAGFLLNVMAKNTEAQEKLTSELHSFSESIGIIELKMGYQEEDIAENREFNRKYEERFQNHIGDFSNFGIELAQLKVKVGP